MWEDSYTLWPMTNAQVGSIELRPKRLDGTRSARVVWTHAGEVRREAFRTEWEAVRFRADMTRAGGEYPAGYVPGEGYGGATRDGGRTVTDLVAEYADSPATKTQTQDGRDLIRDVFRRMAGEHRIAKTRVGDVDAALAQDLLDDCGTRYAKGSLDKLLAYMRASFRYARSQNYLDASKPLPFDGRMRLASRTGVRVESVFLRDAEITALLAAIPERYSLLVRVILASGIRRGEAWALRVMSVRVARDGRVTLIVDKSESQHNGRKLGPTKNGKTREVPLPRELSGEVAALASGRHFAERLFDVPSYQTFRRAWVTAVRESGLLAVHPGGVRVHDLRHTHASQLMAAGVPVQTVSMWLGHSSIAVTVDLYGHIHVDDARLMAAIDSI